jgi:hypothetical protein
VPDVPRRELYLLCQRRKDLLQEGLCQVRHSFVFLFDADIHGM